MDPNLPRVALSLRQPWAWLVVSGLKDIENRNWRTDFRGPVLVHAAKGMTRKEYEACALYCRIFKEYLTGRWALPAFEDLKRGGIVGQVTITDCVSRSSSHWFFGRYGFVLKDARELEFLPMKGALGFFSVESALAGNPWKEGACR